jgi:hypothetical protein
LPLPACSADGNAPLPEQPSLSLLSFPSKKDQGQCGTFHDPVCYSAHIIYVYIYIQIPTRKCWTPRHWYMNLQFYSKKKTYMNLQLLGIVQLLVNWSWLYALAASRHQTATASYLLLESRP